MGETEDRAAAAAEAERQRQETLAAERRRNQRIADEAANECDRGSRDKK